VNTTIIISMKNPAGWNWALIQSAPLAKGKIVRLRDGWNRGWTSAVTAARQAQLEYEAECQKVGIQC